MLFVVVWGWICYFMLIYFCQKTVCMAMKMTVTVHQSVLQFVKTVFMNKHKKTPHKSLYGGMALGVIIPINQMPFDKISHHINVQRIGVQCRDVIIGLAARLQKVIAVFDRKLF